MSLYSIHPPPFFPSQKLDFSLFFVFQDLDKMQKFVFCFLLSPRRLHMCLDATLVQFVQMMLHVKQSHQRICVQVLLYDLILILNSISCADAEGLAIPGHGVV